MKLRKLVKKVGRVHAKVFSKVVKVVAPIAAAVATIYTGPAGGAAVAASLAGASRYAGATAARAKGLKGRDARAKGRSLSKQVLKYGLLGTGVGAATAAIAGGSVLSGITGLGSSTLSKLGLSSPKPSAVEFDRGGLADPGGEAPVGQSQFGNASQIGNQIFPDNMSGGELTQTKLPDPSGEDAGSFGNTVLTGLMGLGSRALNRGVNAVTGSDSASADKKTKTDLTQEGLLDSLRDLFNPQNPNGETDWTKIALIGGGVLLIALTAKKAA